MICSVYYMFACFIQTAILAVAKSSRGVCMNSRFLLFFFFFFLQSWFSEWIELKPLFSSWNQRVFSNVVYLSPPNALRAVQHMWTILRPPPEVEVPVHFTFHIDMLQWKLHVWMAFVCASLFTSNRAVSLVTFENISFTHSLLRNIM